MHIYGVGSKGNMGSSVSTLMNRKYNKSKEKMGGQSFREKNISATVNAEVKRVQLTLDSNRVSEITRPFITVDSEVRDIWTDVTDTIDHVSFLPGNRPSMSYKYDLSDDEIKGFVDAGMYSNPRFEALLNNLLESEQYEVIKDVELRTIDVIHDGVVVPIISAEDIGYVEQGADKDNPDNYTTFDYAVERSIEMALQLEAEGISTDSLMSTEDDKTALQEVEVDVEIDDIFETGLIEDEHGGSTVDEEEIIKQLEQDMDREIDITDQIELTTVFGQTSEEERIQEMRENRRRGIPEDTGVVEDTDDLDDLIVDEPEEVSVDEYDDVFGDDFESTDDFGFDDMDDNFELDDEMEFEIDTDELEDDEDDLEF